MKKTLSRVFAQFQKSGIHCYPDAPKGVEYLKNPHRHMFHFRVELEVFHEDRDVEFILFKEWLEGLYTDSILSLNHKSCEMISDDLAELISEKFPNRDIRIEVSEDGENGSVAEYRATRGGGEIYD